LQLQIAYVIQPFRIAEQSYIALAPHLFDDRRHNVIMLGLRTFPLHLERLQLAKILNRNHRLRLHDNLVQRILDDTLRTGFFQAGNDMAYRRLF